MEDYLGLNLEIVVLSDFLFVGLRNLLPLDHDEGVPDEGVG